MIISIKANINAVEPSWKEKCIQYYCSLIGSGKNPNITECDKNGSLRSLVLTQKRKLAKCKTCVDYDYQVKNQTHNEIKTFHNDVVSIWMLNKKQTFYWMEFLSYIQ